jgi:hypothetical protein
MAVVDWLRRRRSGIAHLAAIIAIIIVVIILYYLFIGF